MAMTIKMLHFHISLVFYYYILCENKAFFMRYVGDGEMDSRIGITLVSVGLYSEYTTSRWASPNLFCLYSL